MTPKSYNTPNGICKAINEADLNNVDYLILEMGAKKKGEIKQLCRWFKPDVGVLTAIGLQHLDTFKNIETIFETKCELQNNLNGNGVMVFNCYNEGICNTRIVCCRFFANGLWGNMVYVPDDGDCNISDFQSDLPLCC